MEIIAITPADRRRHREFILLPWKIYHGHCYWVPPLLTDIREKLDQNKNPFFEYGKVKLFAAVNSNGEMLGRIAAIMNPVHRQIYGEATGFFGMFECQKDIEAARLLLGAVGEHLKANGCISIIGPVNFSTNDESGLLVEGADDFPSFMSNYCPPYYHELISDNGYDKVIDTLSYEAETGHDFPAKYFRVHQAALDNKSVTLRHFTKENAGADIAVIREIYNESFKDTWGFLPLTKREADYMAEKFTAIADFKLVWIAFHDGNPAGMILALPDINEILRDLNGRLFPFGFVRFILRKNRLSRYRVIAFGVLPRYRALGIETLLIQKVRARMTEGGYERAEFSVVMENNKRMRNLLESFGFRLRKRYRLYGARI